MARWSRERFWDAMENFAALWFGLAVADALIGLGLVVILLSQPFDTHDPAVVVSVVDLAVVVVTVLPLSYVLYRVRQRREEEF